MTAREIADSLSEAQRRCLQLFEAPPIWKSSFDLGFCSNWIPQTFVRRGMLERDGDKFSAKAPVTDYFYALTPLGQQVRKELERRDA